MPQLDGQYSPAPRPDLQRLRRAPDDDKASLNSTEAAACFLLFPRSAAISRLVSAGCLIALCVFGALAADQIVPPDGQRGDHPTNQLDEGLTAYRRGDYAAAMRLLQPLANQGMAIAQNSLGVMYANGRGVPRDYEQAAMWYRKAADQGDDEAQANLGAMYAQGQGVPQDFEKAVNWYARPPIREMPTHRPVPDRLRGMREFASVRARAPKGGGRRRGAHR